MLPDRNIGRSIVPSGAIGKPKNRSLLALVVTGMLTSIVFRVRQLRNARGVHQTENVLRIDRAEKAESETLTRVEDMEVGNMKCDVLPRSLESDYGGDEEVWFDAPEHPIYQRSSEQPQTPLTGTRMNSMTPCPSEDTAGVDSGSVGESISRASPSAVAEADIFIRNFRNLQDSRNLQNQRNLQDQQSLKNQRNLENQRVLRDQIRNDLIDVACTQGMSTIMEHVCSDEDLYLYRDGNGALCRMVTNPPYSDEVVRLFAHRTNPIIHSKSKRAVASSFLDAPVESKFENCESSRRFQRDFEN
ncbi:hypothetical protein KJ359_005814 [Pestalotiopsis sp. 9143b]|nr:hypothetical protein KJ359_005814 [Pestalotiopsis sp. 9143b]